MIYESIIAGLLILCATLIYFLLMQRIRIKYLDGLNELYSREQRYCEELLFESWQIFGHEQWREFREKWKGIADAHGRTVPEERVK